MKFHLEETRKHFYFFFLESKDGISELKELQTLFGQNLNLIVFRKEESMIPDELSSAVFINLPIIYRHKYLFVNISHLINKNLYNHKIILSAS